MSERLAHSPLAAIEALEAGAFRLGQAVRQILAEHPGLPIRAFHPSVYVHGYLDGPSTVRASVEISAHDVDGVDAWARALGGRPEYRTHTQPGHAFLHAHLDVPLGGAVLRVVGTRSLTDAEAAALPPVQPDATGEGETAAEGSEG